ncbi:thermonuclease family protein [Candidatus Bathyarchaeota archaeon]|nr:thermonuclease family protein [Candidatus Bathyarchaeota archaeon]
MKDYLFGFVIVLIFIFSVPVVYSSGEFDTSTVVSLVIDGDTFETTSEGTVRLADIDAPEYYQYDYQASRDFLISLIYGKTVYLDIDDLYRTGTYGRLICVAYVNYNSTHYLNVNKALLVEGYADISNYNDEFSPYSWSLYIPKQDIPEFPLWTPLRVMLLAVMTVAVIYKRLLNKPNEEKRGVKF